MTSARRRVELLLPILTVTECIQGGNSRPNDPDAINCKNHLMEARRLVLDGITGREFEKITRRTLKLYDRIFEKHIRLGTSPLRTALVIYHWIQKLVTSEYMQVPSDSAFGKAMKLFLEGVVEGGYDDKLFADTELDADVIFRDMQSAGYYGGITLA